MRWQHYIFYFFLIWYSFGVILVGFNLLPTWLEWANSVFIITAGVLGVIYFVRGFGAIYGVSISTLIFITTFIVEYLGSTHAILFGSYHYTQYFAPNLFGVPIAIGFAWIMVIATSHAIVHIVRLPNRWIRSIIASLLAVVFDLVLDPVSFKVKEYWVWEQSGYYYDIPLTNFLGWFLTALVLHIVIGLYGNLLNPDKQWQRRMVLLYSLMICMFAFIALLNKLYLAAIIPVIVLAILLVTMKRDEHYV
ncbi:carotenoid biosynthesis protein [Lysinibacillus mangiferihumi]|uniref:Carotenoid biosynthesis protein n=1 Tax=Lysinibacillus mangiferihumi TaxID=1130819 RepID=A0A4U2ZCY3_9BACI|nr:carotenoid biosynthesis protein [Lysinibacillus mangiferihumi]TKI72556.1 carotenoid biosynthesis protein [Lysinibacillus mangiferihumi]